MVTIETYAETPDVDQDGEPPYVITSMISYLVCTDPADPGGTEVWSDMDYDDEADPFFYQSLEAADAAARKAADKWVANGDYWITWDGTPAYG